jgi:hypothetical protein
MKPHRVYLVEFCGIQGYVAATSSQRAKRRAMISAQEAGYWSPGKSLKGMRCKLADYVPPDVAVIND